MEIKLKLREIQHKQLWERREAIQTKFNVQINSPFAFSESSETELWMYNGFSPFGYVMISIQGEIADVAAAEKHISEVFMKPEIIEIFSYPQDLEPVFGNPVWIQIFEETYDVCITRSPDSELTIAGKDSSVRSAVSSIKEIVNKYSECKDTLIVHNENSLAQKLASALKACKAQEVTASTFEKIPNDVITILLALLENAYKENTPLNDDENQLLEESVVVLDTPEEKADVSVIVLDSDSDEDDRNNNSNRKPPETFPKNNPKKKKRKKMRKSNSKKLARVACDLDLQKQGNWLKSLPHENGYLQHPKVDSAMDKSKLPVVENSAFIPFSQKSANTSSGQAPVALANQPAAEAKGKPTEAVPETPKRLRPIIIDGCNVAFYCSQGRWKEFSWKRIEKCMQFFLDRGHTDVKVFLPNSRRPMCYEKSGNQQLVDNLENRQLIVFTPSRRIEGKTINCYDDRFIVDYAFRTGGIIVSNDNYRDLMNENIGWAKTIKDRLLMFVFAGDELMIPEDPLGQKGPRLNEFLAF